MAQEDVRMRLAINSAKFLRQEGKFTSFVTDLDRTKDRIRNLVNESVSAVHDIRLGLENNVITSAEAAAKLAAVEEALRLVSE